MAKVLLYVHGTGTRKDAYATSKKVIEDQLCGRLGSAVQFADCLWGEEIGAQLHAGGKSIPKYQPTHDDGNDASAVLWELLLQDPTFELSMLAECRPLTAGRSPAQVAQSASMLEKFKTLPSKACANNVLAIYGLNPGGADAPELQKIIDAIVESDGYVAAKATPIAGEPRFAAALSRSVVASLQKQALESGFPVLGRAECNRAAREIKRLFATDVRGVATVLLAPLAGLVGHLIAVASNRARTALTNFSYPAAGDILLYQAHGDRLRDFVRSRIEAYPDDEVYVLAHSLGGIACVELLAKAAPPNVKHLITFGSQAPFLYEIGALSTFDGQCGLPAFFPQWLNFFDPNDPLSYVGHDLFGDKVEDVMVQSGAAFPASHGAYLYEAVFWDKVEALLKDA